MKHIMDSRRFGLSNIQFTETANNNYDNQVSLK